MSIRPIPKKKISDEVLEQMKEHILSGEWLPGTKIPGEIELASLFNVSRVSIRDAIQRLVGMGVLSIQRGEGTFVAELLPADHFNALLPFLMIKGANLMELLEFRSMIEVESARLAALRANTGDILRMQSIIENMDKSKDDYIKFAAEDLNFHTSLALATHNSVIIKVNAIIHDMLQSAMEEVVKATGFQGGIYYHGRILEAVKNRDEAAAAAAMKEHIGITISRMSAEYRLY